MTNLVAEVIELKYKNVVFSTINTWMFRKIFAHEDLVLFSKTTRSLVNLFYMMLFVVLVISLRTLLTALSTKGLEIILTVRVFVEVLKGLW